MYIHIDKQIYTHREMYTSSMLFVICMIINVVKYRYTRWGYLFTGFTVSFKVVFVSFEPTRV